MARKKRYRYKVEIDPAVLKRRKIIKEVLIWIFEIALVIAAAYYIAFFWLEKTPVIGNAMSTTLEADDKVLINKFTYLFREPKRFEVVVFNQTNNEHNYYDVKRIIGLPGETITIDKNTGYIYIDGELLEEPILVDAMYHAGLAEDGITLDEDEYFVLGDNRNNSEDSRYATYGNIVRSDIIGIAWIKLDPFLIISEINAKEENEDKKTDK